MSKEELIKELKIIRDGNYGDLQIDHIAADNLLLKYIDDEEVTEVFEDIEKWYA